MVFQHPYLDSQVQLIKVDEITSSAKLYDINKVMDSLKTFIPEYEPDYTKGEEWVKETANKIINN